MIPINELKNAKYITLIVDAKSFALGSALYSFVLMQHKKVALICNETLPKQYSFIPWYDKLKKQVAVSSDYIYKVDTSSKELYSFFQENNYKINQKIATSLYSALVIEFDFFHSKKVDGTIFALASALITLGADYDTCRTYMYATLPLSYIRIQAILFSSMLLKDNATIAELFISTQDLQSSGATFEECFIAMEECLRLVHVQEVRLVKSDDNNKIIKIIKDI